MGGEQEDVVALVEGGEGGFDGVKEEVVVVRGVGVDIFFD